MADVFSTSIGKYVEYINRHTFQNNKHPSRLHKQTRDAHRLYFPPGFLPLTPLPHAYR